jgi:DNA-binding MarR family transcriptional regulator
VANIMHRDFPHALSSHLAKQRKQRLVANAAEHEVDLARLDGLVGYGLRRALAKQRERFRSVFSRYGIRPVQFAVLVLIRDSMPVRQAEVGRAIEMKRANVVTVLDELIERGLVTRQAARDDLRANVLALTPKGIEYTDKLLVLHSKLERDVAKKLGKREFDKLVQLLYAFRKLNSMPKLD